MPELPQELYTAEQSRELDQIIIEQHHISGATLMARAGAAALNTIKQHWPQAEHILVVCGPGNNGGDGYELARQALLENYRVRVIELGHIEKMSAEACAARQALAATGQQIQRFENNLPSADVIVDALFGTGLAREITGIYAEAIKAINQHQRSSVLSLDIPSGLHADTGNVLGIAVNASATISFLCLNRGLFTGDGPDYCGQICFDDLQAPSEAYQKLQPVARLLNLKESASHLAPRKRTGHKGLYGHLLIIGGDLGMSGAARIAAEAGARVGAGLTSIATRSGHSPVLNLTRPELMCHGIEHPEELAPLLNKASVLAMGPGLGQSDWSQSLFHFALESALPMVVDADALNILSQHPQYRDNWILTPHPGEAARLLGCNTRDIHTDRFEAVQQLQARYGGVVVLKGAGTLIYDGKLPVRLSAWGNPGMGSGGMGDALSGVISGLLAQHLSLMEAACTGVMLHGMAADKAAEQDGERGMLAMDLMPHLRHLANLKDI